mgnify:CR=1 FL=1
MLKFEENAAIYIDEIMPGGSFVTRDEGFDRLLDDIKKPEISEYPVPENIKAKMRKYQVVGYRWLKNLARYSMGGILADVWGLERLCRLSYIYVRSLKASRL